MPLSGNDLGDELVAAIGAVAPGDYGAYADYSVAVSRAMGGAVVGHLTSLGNLVGAAVPGLVPAIGGAGPTDVLRADGTWGTVSADVADGTYGDVVVTGASWSVPGLVSLATSIAGVATTAASDTADVAADLATLDSATAAALADKAPLASPSLTGTPLAPTAASATSTTQIATTAFVHALITDVIGAAPAALDTLKELADAINDDASFAGTVTAALAGKASTSHVHAASDITSGLATVATSGSAADLTGTLAAARIADASLSTAKTSGLDSALAAKAPLASPALTGTPTAPTADAGTNTTQIATTAHVVASLAAYQPLDGTLTALATLGAAASAGIWRQTGATTVVRLADTTAGRALLEAADAAAQRTALALGTAATAALGITGQTTTAPVQPHQGFTKRCEWLTAGNTVAITSLGMGASSNTGTPTQRNIATGSLFGLSKRCGFVSSGTAGQSAGPRLGVLQFALGDVAGGGGFAFVCRFGVSDGATVANSRMFVGFTSSISAIGNVEPSSLTSIIGVGCDAGETVLSILNNDGSGTATKTSLGANFPSQTLSTDLYRLELYCAPNGSTVTYRVTRENTGHTSTAALSSDLPTSTTLLAPQLWRNNGTTALAVGIDMFSLYIETNS
jgi:hypothetical protein